MSEVEELTAELERVRTELRIARAKAQLARAEAEMEDLKRELARALEGMVRDGSAVQGMALQEQLTAERAAHEKTKAALERLTENPFEAFNEMQDMVMNERARAEKLREALLTLRGLHYEYVRYGDVMFDREDLALVDEALAATEMKPACTCAAWNNNHAPNCEVKP